MLMPRAESWRQRVEQISATLEKSQVDFLSRGDVETLFQLQRRAALRLMQRFNPELKSYKWRIKRLALLKWLKNIGSEVAYEKARSKRVWQTLQKSEMETRQLRAELEKMGRPDPASWKVAPDILDVSVSGLPDEVVLAPGQIAVSFPPDDPLIGAQRLHLLSLAMLNDWTSFCRKVGVISGQREDREIDNLLNELEVQKRTGITAL
jgi:hypothetical protein